MEDSAKDQTQGKYHVIMGKIKKFAGKISFNSELEGKGKDEERTGKLQRKVGEVKKVVGK